MNQTYAVHVGDVLDVIPTLGPFDAVLSDPPYGLAFMARDWDHAVPGPDVWRVVLDALRPGAPLAAFGGTRTYHRLVCAIEDAGAEIRDSLMWLYGSGFPKNLDISKAIDKAAGAEREVTATIPDRWTGKGQTFNFATDRAQSYVSVLGAPATPAAQRFDGYGTALKPSYEPIIWAMKTRDGSFANNATEHGVAGINIDAGRIGTTTRLNSSSPRVERTGFVKGFVGGTHTAVLDHGRWPANVILDDEAGAMLDAQSGEAGGGFGVRGASTHTYGGGKGFTQATGERVGHGDSGGASRFFYCAKASRAEREAGLDTFRASNVNDGRETSIDNPYQRGDTQRRNVHPTVKPVDLCRWLAALLLPPPRADGAPRRLLVPFSGSGSEMIGALLAGWDHVVGVELDPHYAAIAAARLAHWDRYRCIDSEAAEREAAGQQRLFSNADLFDYMQEE
jgi:hypothetical protein